MFFLKVDISAEELNNSIKSEVAVHSDIKPFAEALTQKLSEKKFSLQPAGNKWWQTLQDKQKKNTEFVEVTYSEFRQLKTLVNYVFFSIAISVHILV